MLQRYVRCVCNYKFRKKREKQTPLPSPSNPIVPIQPPSAALPFNQKRLSSYHPLVQNRSCSGFLPRDLKRQTPNRYASYKFTPFQQISALVLIPFAQILSFPVQFHVSVEEVLALLQPLDVKVPLGRHGGESHRQPDVDLALLSKCLRCGH